MFPPGFLFSHVAVDPAYSLGPKTEKQIIEDRIQAMRRVRRKRQILRFGLRAMRRLLRQLRHR